MFIHTPSAPPEPFSAVFASRFGYEMTPKIILIVVSSCFPVTVGVLDGFRAGKGRAEK